MFVDQGKSFKMRGTMFEGDVQARFCMESGEYLELVARDCGRSRYDIGI